MADDQLKRVQLKVPADWLRDLDAWRRLQRDLPTRSEAIRRAVAAAAARAAKRATRRNVEAAT